MRAASSVTGFVPGHSGGTVLALNELPFSPRGAPATEIAIIKDRTKSKDYSRSHQRRNFARQTRRSRKEEEQGDESVVPPLHTPCLILYADANVTRHASPSALRVRETRRRSRETNPLSPHSSTPCLIACALGSSLQKRHADFPRSSRSPRPRRRRRPGRSTRCREYRSRRSTSRSS